MEFQVTKSFILETATLTMLRELAERYLGMSPDAVTKTANAADRATKNRGESMAPYMKLRKAILTKMDNGFATEHPSWSADGVVTLDFACMEPAPEPEQTASDEPAFGANKGAKTKKAKGEKKAPAHKGAVPRTGGYTVNKRPNSPSVNGGDAGKWEIWEHVWNCATFEEYFASAPAKGFTSKTNRMITASMEMSWALKSGWITINE